MIIGVCGFGSTGSSAVSDYLCEFDQIKTIDKIEFTWVSEVDGLIDLETHLMNPHTRTGDSIVAINRYLKKMDSHLHDFKKNTSIDVSLFKKSIQDFVQNITLVSWNWYDYSKEGKFHKHLIYYFTKNRLIPWLERKRQKRLNCWPLKKVNLSIKPDNFYVAAKKHVNELLKALGKKDDDQIVVLDQPFSGNNPQAAFKFYDDPKAIVVDRDPRDNYIFARTKLLGKNHFMPVDNVSDFIKYYRALREKQPYQQDDSRILRIKFEDMIYNYENTTKTIRDFLGLNENVNQRTVFDPALSINNTQLWRRFPQFADDVKQIEKELHEYLFDFSGCPIPDSNGEMFFGKSPLHK